MRQYEQWLSTMPAPRRRDRVQRKAGSPTTPLAEGETTSASFPLYTIKGLDVSCMVIFYCWQESNVAASLEAAFNQRKQPPLDDPRRLSDVGNRL